MSAPRHDRAAAQDQPEDRVEDRGQSRRQERDRQRTEAAEHRRLSSLYFAYMQALQPGAFHCFCGTHEELRQAVAELVARYPDGPAALAATGDSDRGRRAGAARADDTRALAGTARARGALRAAQQTGRPDDQRAHASADAADAATSIVAGDDR